MLRTVAALAVFKRYAPPAMVLWHDLHFQIPVQARLTLSFPQKTQLYLECWATSIFLTTFRREEPYRVPYLPQIPTFFVRLPYRNMISIGLQVMLDGSMHGFLLSCSMRYMHMMQSWWSLCPNRTYVQRSMHMSNACMLIWLMPMYHKVQWCILAFT